MPVQRTDIKGSGYIQFPPQRPFAQKLEKQPPTLSVRLCAHTTTAMMLTMHFAGAKTMCVSHALSARIGPSCDKIMSLTCCAQR